jgi:hypothetical protein
MAVAMMGGIVAATVLTLGFLPALYALWFRVRRESLPEPEAPGAPVQSDFGPSPVLPP